MKNNSFGVSLLELTVALALMGGLSLMTMSMLNQTENTASQFEKSLSLLNLENIITGRVLSQDGCQQFRGFSAASVGTKFNIRRPGRIFENGNYSIKFGPPDVEEIILYQEGDIVGEVKINEMEVHDFTLLQNNDAAIIDLRLKFLLHDKEKKFSSNSKEFEKHILVPVGLADNAGTLEVSDCQLDKTQLYNDLYEKLCQGTLFRDTTAATNPSLDCGTLILWTEREIERSICIDITGSAANFDSSTGNCNFSRSHAGKDCPGGQYLYDFNSTGGLKCR